MRRHKQDNKRTAQFVGELVDTLNQAEATLFHGARGNRIGNRAGGTRSAAGQRVANRISPAERQRPQQLAAQLQQPRPQTSGRQRPQGVWHECGQLLDRQATQLAPICVAAILGLVASLVLLSAPLAPTGAPMAGYALAAALVPAGLLARTSHKQLGLTWSIGAGLVAGGWLAACVHWGWSWPMLSAVWLSSVACGWRWWTVHRPDYPTSPPGASGPENTAATTARLLERWNSKVATGTLKDCTIAPASQEWGDTPSDTKLIPFDLHLEGKTVTEAQSQIERLAVDLRCDTRQLVIDQPHTGNGWRDAALARLQYILNSPITGDVGFTLDGQAGEFVVGRYADGRGGPTIEAVVKDGVKHLMVIGATGVGKSVLLVVQSIKLRARYRTVTVYRDPKRMSHVDHARHVSVLSVGEDAAESVKFTECAEQLLAGLQMQAHAHGWSGFNPDQDGYQQSQTTGESVYRPLYQVIMDEADMMWTQPGMAERWGRLTKTGRALGVQFVGASQNDRQDIFGGSELLRGSMCGNVVLMRVDGGQTGGQMIADDLPKSKTLPKLPGYCYVSSPSARVAAARLEIVAKSEDDPNGRNADTLLRAHPDAAMCPIGRKAFEPYAVDEYTDREEHNRQQAFEQLDKFLAGSAGNGVTSQVPPLAAGNAVTSAPQVPTLGFVATNSQPIEPVASREATDAQLSVLDALRCRRTRTPDIARLLRVSEQRVRTLLAQLIDRGDVVKLGEGPATCYELADGREVT